MAARQFPTILVLSTYAEDRMIYLETGEREVRPGGPALWIERTYKRMGVPYRIITSGQMVLVDLELVKGEPLPGKVRTNGSRVVIAEEQTAAGILINTLDDFDLNQVLKLNGTVLLDIAPYTRTGEFLDQRRNVDLPPPEVRSRISIIKANHEEYPYMPRVWAEEQKQERILIHTLGKDGLNLFAKGREFHIPAPQGKPKNLLGAGDTFGSAFLAHFVQNGGDAKAACIEAVNQVASLFDEKSQRS